MQYSVRVDAVWVLGVGGAALPAAQESAGGERGQSMATLVSRFITRRRLAATAAAAAGFTASVTASHCEPELDEEPRRRLPRVLITGFNDWHNLSGNLWRCRDNPSCRVLLGNASSSAPVERTGPLVRALKKNTALASSADFEFQTLPVTWGTTQGLDLTSYDLVIHLGLGVYDCYDKILLEKGAYNLRSASKDVLQVCGPNEPIEAGAAECLPITAAMQRRYDALAREPPVLLTAGDEHCTFKVEEAPARPANTYICNESHYRALRACELPKSRLKAAYFIHLPYAREKEDSHHEKLGDAVAALVSRIINVEFAQT